LYPAVIARIDTVGADGNTVRSEWELTYGQHVITYRSREMAEGIARHFKQLHEYHRQQIAA
jgi:hypothetical protein